MVEEIIREKIFKRTNKEVPYQTRQENVGFTPCKNGDLRIDQVVYVAKNAHKVSNNQFYSLDLTFPHSEFLLAKEQLL